MNVFVGIPAYNAEKTLEKTYRAIPKGSYDDIILVDDASGAAIGGLHAAAGQFTNEDVAGFSIDQGHDAVLIGAAHHCVTFEMPEA